MKDYCDSDIRLNVLSAYKKLGGTLPINIGIVTYNRLKYLQKCLWSLIASSSYPIRIFVIDDSSKDGTVSFLQDMSKRKLIHRLILNDKNKGTAENYNNLMDMMNDSPWNVFLNDDMYIHRYWEVACLDIINEFDNCGMVNFYNFSHMKVEKGYTQVNKRVWKGPVAGLGAVFMNTKLFYDAGRYIMRQGKLMGYFTTPFCQRVLKSNMKRKQLYFTIPSYAVNMDTPTSKLNEIINSVDTGYIQHRLTHKKGKKRKEISGIIKEIRGKNNG